jgi:hypothetical protein
MKYTKPEIVIVSDAVSAIQGLEKDQGPDDNILQQPSAGAYHSDE